MKSVRMKFTFLMQYFMVMLLVDQTMQNGIKINGDLTIVGLFQVHKPEGDSCGMGVSVSSVMTSEAVKWYIEGLNKNGNLPFKIGLEGHETCRLESKASEIAINVMNRALTNDTIIGVIGPEFSSEAETISPILSSVPKANRLVQVGFSTTAARLEDNTMYPNFVRVVPNDNIQIEVMIKTMKSLEWNRIAIIYGDDTYGRDASSRLAERAEEENICISMASAIPIDTSGDYISSLINDIIFGTQNRPSINGIIYIGSSSFARSIFIALENTGFTSVPIVMLSEGINMQTSVFKHHTGSIMKSSKGSLVIAPRYIEVTEFTNHWRSIFTNKTYFEKEVITNPWLMDLYYEITNCDRRDCDFAELTENQYSSAFEQQILYVQYAILAAHTLVKGTREAHDQYCSSSGFCDAFKTNFRSGDLIDILDNIHIDMETDFHWKLGLSAPNRKMILAYPGVKNLKATPRVKTTSPTGAKRLSSLTEQQNLLNNTIKFAELDDLSSYEVFNYRRDSGSSTEFDLIKISENGGKDLTLNKTKLRDYTNSGGEIFWPSVRKAQCNVDQKCAECIFIVELRESIIFEPGDIFVVMVVPVFDRDKNSRDGCGQIRTVSGYQTVEAARFAVNKVNSKTGDFSNFFPGMKIGLIVLNSCNNPLVIQRKIHELFHNGVKMVDGSYLDVSKRIIGFIGDIGSSVSIAVGELLSRLQFVQISFASTSPLLSDRSKYPFFMRVVTPDDAQAKAMIGIIQKLESNYIQIVYSTGAYGEAGKDKIKEEASKHKICVVQEIAVEESGSEFEIFEKLRRFTHARIVIIFLQSHRVGPVMLALTSQINNRGEFVFIGSEAWNRKRGPLATDNKQVLLGSYSLSLEMYEDNELRSHIQQLTSKPFNQNPWATLYLQEKRNCYFNSSYDKTKKEMCSEENDDSSNPDFVLDSWTTSAYVATKSLLIGGNEFLRDRCGSQIDTLCDEFVTNPTGFAEVIRGTKLDLDGTGNKIKVFNTNGDGNIGYRIYNIQKDDDRKNMIYVEVGRYPLEGTFTFERKLTVTPTGKQIVSTCPNVKACSGCLRADVQQNSSDVSEKWSLNVGLIAIGVLLAVAVIAIVVLVICIVKMRRVHKKADGTYITPCGRGERELHTLPRQETIGSEEFASISACSPKVTSFQAVPSEIQTTDK